jgi:hypothetical protein
MHTPQFCVNKKYDGVSDGHFGSWLMLRCSFPHDTLLQQMLMAIVQAHLPLDFHTGSLQF